MTDAPPREPGHAAGRAAADFARIDGSAPRLAPRPVPGWCAANAVAAIYGDPVVFRSGRHMRAAGGGAQC
ncbi:hypothetical protein [Burkholderia arboris]|uniref:hypothetical protein n=1 Tax=Burkholderia arboris TaxID=488730 RepID=UPI001FC874E8|nr:hypothetical protein [Burkholderia arboris]